MKFTLILTTLLSVAFCQKIAPTSLQIGIKHQISAVDCIAARNGDELSMEYTGSLFTDGSVFDTSRGRAPFTFTLGQGQVIKGTKTNGFRWDKGLLGMCIGEKRKLTIPSEMGYGKTGSGAKIPANAVLVFEVELLGIKGRLPKNEL